MCLTPRNTPKCGCATPAWCRSAVGSTSTPPTRVSISPTLTGVGCARWALGWCCYGVRWDPDAAQTRVPGRADCDAPWAELVATLAAHGRLASLDDAALLDHSPRSPRRDPRGLGSAAAPGPRAHPDAAGRRLWARVRADTGLAGFDGASMANSSWADPWCPQALGVEQPKIVTRECAKLVETGMLA